MKTKVKVNHAVKLDKNTIDDIFNSSNNQHIAWLKLYKICYPEWDIIDELDNYPSVNEKTNDYIWLKFMELDKKYHPEVLSGGLWMNVGFACDNTIPEWQVKPCGYTVKDN